MNSSPLQQSTENFKFYEESFKSVRIHRACMKFKKKIINFHHSTARHNFSQNLSDSSAIQQLKRITMPRSVNYTSFVTTRWSENSV